MSTHPHEHEELLAALAAGDRRPAEPEIALRLRECAECAQEWAELQDSLRQLERLAGEERSAVSELGAMRSAPGEERVLATLEALAAGETKERPAARRTSLWLAAAALLLVGAWIVIRSRDGGDAGSGRHAPVQLGDGLVLHEPVGPGPTFSWSFPGAESFRLRIYPDDDRNGTPLIDRKLKENQWIPSAEERALLPARIFWKVEARDAAKNPIGSASASASLDLH